MLFEIEPKVTEILPGTFDNACKLATSILRSDFHMDLLCQMHTDPGTGANHIDKTRLSAFLLKNGVFMVDKIRQLQMLNARACTIREYDAFKIYFNPLLLLEMKDREVEEQEVHNAGGVTNWPDLLQPMVPIFDTTGNPIRRQHNSLAWLDQMHKLNPAATQANATTSKAKKTSAASTPGGSSVIVPSGLSVVEKNTWITAILLVHEADHLLNGMFSTYLINGQTPEKMMRVTDQLKFKDIGHMMELELYGFVIQHGFDDLLPAPFAIEEVLGATHSYVGMPKFVITPSTAMRACLTDPDKILTVTIDAALLLATATGNGIYEQGCNPVEIGSLKSAPADDDAMLITMPCQDDYTTLQGGQWNV